MATNQPSSQAPWKRLPIIKDVIRSAGLQRAMLIAGLVITIGFLITALFAPLIAPYTWAQTSAEFGSFGTQQHRLRPISGEPPFLDSMSSPALSGEPARPWQSSLLRWQRR